MNIDFSTGAIEMVRAKVRVVQFTIINMATNTVVPLSSWPAFLFIAKAGVNDADGAAVVSKSLGNGITVTDPTNGILQVQIEPADTLALANTRATYLAQFQGRDPNGEPWALWQGTLILQPNLIGAN